MAIIFIKPFLFLGWHLNAHISVLVFEIDGKEVKATRALKGHWAPVVMFFHFSQGHLFVAERTGVFFVTAIPIWLITFWLLCQWYFLVRSMLRIDRFVCFSSLWRFFDQLPNLFLHLLRYFRVLLQFPFYLIIYFIVWTFTCLFFDLLNLLDWWLIVWPFTSLFVLFHVGLSSPFYIHSSRIRTSSRFMLRSFWLIVSLLRILWALIVVELDRRFLSFLLLRVGRLFHYANKYNNYTI